MARREPENEIFSESTIQVARKCKRGARFEKKGQRGLGEEFQKG